MNFEFKDQRKGKVFMRTNKRTDSKSKMLKCSVMGLALMSVVSLSAYGETEKGEDNLKGGGEITTTVKEIRMPSDSGFRRIMVEGSAVSATYDGTDASKYSLPSGYSVGVLFDLIGKNEMVLETGLVYRRVSTNVESGLPDNTLNADYVGIPLSAKYYFSGQDVTSIYLKAGVIGSALTGNNTIIAAKNRNVEPKLWQTGAQAGLGVKFDFARDASVLVEVDYLRAFESVFDNATVYRSDASAALGMGMNF